MSIYSELSTYRGHFSSNNARKTPQSSQASARYGVSVVSARSDWSSTIAIDVLYILSSYIWLRYMEIQCYAINLLILSSFQTTVNGMPYFIRYLVCSLQLWYIVRFRIVKITYRPTFIYHYSRKIFIDQLHTFSLEHYLFVVMIRICRSQVLNNKYLHYLHISFETADFPQGKKQETSFFKP